MVSSPNTEGLYGNAGATGAAQADPYKDPNESRNMAQVGSDWQAYQDRVAAEKKAAEDAAAAAKAAAAGQVGYRESLEAWKKSANDWTGGQTHFSNPYMIPAMQMRARQNAGAAPKPGAGASSGDWALYNQYVKEMSQPMYSGDVQRPRGDLSYGAGGHMR